MILFPVSLRPAAPVVCGGETARSVVFHETVGTVSTSRRTATVWFDLDGTIRSGP